MPIIAAYPELAGIDAERGRLSVLADPEVWDAIVERCVGPSLLARPSYVYAAAKLESGGLPRLAVWETRQGCVIHPFVQRPVPGREGKSDLISPYDFGGFWFSSNDKARRKSLLAGFEPAFVDWARQSNVVCEFIRFHPFSGVGELSFDQYQVTLHCDNVFVDLSQGYEAAWRGYHPTRRRQVKQGQRGRLQMAFGDDFGQFVTLYHRNLDTLGADAFYYFPVSFLQSIGDNLELRYFNAPDGRLVAAHTYLIDGDTVFAYLCHSERDSLGLRPNDFAYDAAIRDFAARGFRRLHFGGGSPSLYRYKAKFSPDRVPYYVGRAVFDPDAYRALTEARAANGPIDSGYFPAYRAPHRPQGPVPFFQQVDE